MKRIGIFLVAVGLTLGLSGMALAQTTATQTVTLRIAPVNTITVSGSPGDLVISEIPGSATDASTSYEVTNNNNGNRKITARINTAMPANTDLTVYLQPVTGSASVTQSLSTTDVDLVTNIGRLRQSGSITYTFHANPGSVETSGETKTVTFTLTN